MAQDVMSKFYTILNLPLYEKLNELTKIIDQSSPNKELQALFPQLISNIFGSSCYNNGWGLRSVTCESHAHEYAVLVSFLAPRGPLLRLALRLLADPQLRYPLPIDALPVELQLRLRRGRCAQLYADMLSLDAQAVSVVALALNPFDYYMLNFAVHLLSNEQNKSSWEHWNSAYFALACDYLTHYLPAGGAELAPLPPGAGKPLLAAPLQATNRQCTPSLLLQPELAGLRAAPGGASRAEWRSETVLQLFLDVWMSVEGPAPTNMEQQQCLRAPTSPERVRVARVCVKAVHAYCAGGAAGGADGAALRQYARQLLAARGYALVRHLVDSWPLDASFRLVLELWLSLIQPWRYTDANIHHDREAEGAGAVPDAGALAARVAEALPAYTCVLSAVLPRFLRQDLAVYKNAVMLFRIGKVFSQPNLVPILRELEKAIMDNGVGLYYHNPDDSWNNNSSFEYSGGGGGAGGAGGVAHKWAGLARQARAELCPECAHEPLWAERRRAAHCALVRRIHAAQAHAERLLAEQHAALELQNKGVWAALRQWLAGAHAGAALAEARRTPALLAAAAAHYEHIFGLSDRNLSREGIMSESCWEQSSFANSSTFPMSITNKLRSSPTCIQYTGDPDLVPIASYESTILVRILYQISSRLNEIYGSELSRLWGGAGLAGCVARAALAPPCAARGLGARVSLRALGSLPLLARVALGYALARALSYSGAAYAAFLIIAWGLFVFVKATLDYFGLVRS